MSIGPLSSAEERRTLRPTSHPPLYREITRILHAHDPLGMRAGRFTEEYAPEAMSILLRLDRIRSIAELRETIRQSFADWSDPLLAGAAEKYGEVAREVWWAWRGAARAARWRSRTDSGPRRRRPSPNSRPPQRG